eukprot:399006_1
MEQFSAIKQFRKRLINNRTLSSPVPPIGIAIYSTDSQSTDALGSTYDFFWYDMEHSPMSPEKLRTHIMVAHGRNAVALVRIPGPNNNGNNSTICGQYIKHALDMNADGIIVPQIRTVKDVISIVSDCRYPYPHNKRILNGTNLRRGWGPFIPTNYGRIEVDKYAPIANKNIFVCVMIETKEAVDNIEDICKVDGLDCVILGPMDLSANLGTPYDANSVIVQNAIQKVINTAKNNGKYFMFSCGDLNLVKKVNKKYTLDLIHFGADLGNMVTYSTQMFNKLKSKL